MNNMENSDRNGSGKKYRHTFPLQLNQQSLVVVRNYNEYQNLKVEKKPNAEIVDEKEQVKVPLKGQNVFGERKFTEQKVAKVIQKPKEKLSIAVRLKIYRFLPINEVKQKTSVLSKKERQAHS